MSRHATAEFTFVDLADSRETNAKKIRKQATKHSHRDPNRKQRGRNKAKIESPRDLAVRTATDPHSLHATQTDEHRLMGRGFETAPFNIHVDSGRGDPFETFPVPAEPWFNWVLDFYRKIHLPPGIQVVQQSIEEGELYIDWHLREAMTEPCFFYMQLLNAATPIVAHSRFPQDAVVWLRAMVVSSLNEAIADPTRQLSVATLLTVASIALHERLYGDSVLAIEVHGKAYSRMLSMIGGVKQLRVPRIAFALLKFTDDILSASNADKSTADLLVRWAPEDLRQKHPGYEVPMG